MDKPRNSDGTIRRTNKPKRLTNRSLIARWVETETMHLKRLGMGYQDIADHIAAVGRGTRKAMAPLPEGARFPDGYRISMQAVHRAFRRAIVRLPNAEAAELRKLDTERLEAWLLSLQTGIRQGDPRSIEVGVKVLTHKAEINGYKIPARMEVTGTHLNLVVEQQNEAQAAADLERLTIEELREYRRLEAKARAIPEVIDAAPTKMMPAADSVGPGAGEKPDREE